MALFMSLGGRIGHISELGAILIVCDDAGRVDHHKEGAIFSSLTALPMGSPTPLPRYSYMGPSLPPGLSRTSLLRTPSHAQTILNSSYIYAYQKSKS